MNILILGGTTEARLLAAALAPEKTLHTILSLASQTRAAFPLSGAIRCGGFGGISGLTAYLHKTQIHALIDATHPFAAQMSAHAAEAAKASALPFLRLIRPAWQRQSEDQWISVPDFASAPAALGPHTQTVFLTTGRTHIEIFSKTPHQYLLRSIEPPISPLPPHMRLILAHGPFTLEAETSLFLKEEITRLVTKNSGADATRAKLDAARNLRIPVVMIERPSLPSAQEVHTVSEAINWIHRVRRGV